MTQSESHSERKIKLNESVLTEEEFEAKRKELDSQPDIRIIEVGPNEYKTQLLG